MNWHLEVLRKYAVFNGRARRKEYWYFCAYSMSSSSLFFQSSMVLPEATVGKMEWAY